MAFHSERTTCGHQSAPDVATQDAQHGSGIPVPTGCGCRPVRNAVRAMVIFVAAQ